MKGEIMMSLEDERDVVEQEKSAGCMAVVVVVAGCDVGGATGIH